MIKLYIDFDGVILDTAKKFEFLLNSGMIPRKDKKAVLEFFTNIDWPNLIRNTNQINNSIDKIKLLDKSNLYDIAILTHVLSLEEANAKIRYLDKELPGINVIPTHKSIKKNHQVDAYGSILVDDYLGNLIPWRDDGGFSIKFADHISTNEFITIDNLEELITLYPKIKSKVLKKCQE